MVPDSSLTLDEALDRLPKVELHCHIEGTMRLEGVDLDEVRSHILGAPGVADVHDLHAWTITSGMNVVSAHVVLRPGADPPNVLGELCRCLSGDFDIEHSTFQLETADRRRLEERSHA